MTSTIKRTVPGRPQKKSERAPAVVGVGITLVQEMLEPELAGLQPRDCAGPLAQARRERERVLNVCSALVVVVLLVHWFCV